MVLRCDPRSARISAEFVSGDFDGRGESDAAIHQPTDNNFSLVATIPVHGRDGSAAPRALEVCVAVAWALEPDPHGQRLDVAGTALVYDQSDQWTYRYEVVRDHERNRFAP